MVVIYAVHDIVVAMDALDLGQLRALDALMSERHVTRAAERLGLSQPALSHALARLRDRTGDELFVRTARGVTPTPRALELAPQVREILARVDRLLEPPRFSPKTLERTFVIACADFVELRLAHALIRRFSKEAPKVDVMIRPQGAVTPEDLEAGRADLVIGVQVPERAGIMQRRLRDEGFLSVVRRRHPSVKRRLTLSQFVALEHVQIAPRGLPGGPVDDALAALGLSRRIVLKVPSFLPALRVVAETDLILTAPEHLVRDAIRSLPLVAHPTPVAAKPFQLILAWHERAQQDPAHAWLREQVIARLASAAPRR